MPVDDLPDLFPAPAVAAPPAWPDALRESARLRRYDADTYVFNRGQRVESVYQVQTGQVLLRRDGADGESLTLQTAAPGDFVAEASLFSSHYHCDAFCGRASELLAFPARTLLACLQGDPSFAVEWVRLLSRQLMRSRAREERLTLRSPRDRILHCLQLEHDAHGRFTPPGTLMQWAGTLGIAHETLYRALAQMEQEGLIVRDGIQIVLSEVRRKNAGRSRRPQCR
ncbi:Crp/Fnr family transcriptional regulator [Cupriavidus oxalaticus]|uniref:Crp/Fnr family transcriptional regulator n=1 Tax=Cupriavidus oxalaticus TaxID=96344 RepID=A0A5P3V9V8_9BURK|nr:Crp/Fnr family transcriptional regulator [Cupriavidus oxalaticus]QEZ43137.1 Crp/Fnr family transcriptional regulator [Cupriavidus oxalaticus]